MYTNDRISKNVPGGDSTISHAHHQFLTHEGVPLVDFKETSYAHVYKILLNI